MLRTPLTATSVATLLLLTTGCQTTPQVDQPIHAIWVTRFDYQTPDDVRRIIADCQQAGLNRVLFQVRGNATAFYPSNLEPWADELGGTDPGWDPLAVALEEAHARGLKLEAWVNVMPAWRGETPPTNPDQLYNARPEWFWYDQYGQRQPLSWFYVSVNPSLPEVREYLINVFRDIASRYDIDGLHMDYVRYPKEPPATPRDTDIDYPHDERTVALFTADTGLTPQQDPAAWNQWRADQLTKLVTGIRDMLREVNPDAPLTAAVTSRPAGSLERYHQHSQRWVEEGLLDIAYIMNYTRDVDTFRQRLDTWLEMDAQAVVVPGLSFNRIDAEKPSTAAEAVKDKVRIAKDLTGNFCLFAYASLFERNPNVSQASENDDDAVAKDTLRTVVIPYLQEVALETP